MDSKRLNLSVIDLVKNERDRIQRQVRKREIEIARLMAEINLTIKFDGDDGWNTADARRRLKYTRKEFANWETNLKNWEEVLQYTIEKFV